MAEFSFGDLKRIWLAEQTSRGLVELPREFYQDVARYAARLNLELSRGGPLRQELLKGELRNVLKMVHDISFIRVLKGTDEVTRGRLPEPLLERERQAFDEVGRILEKLHLELLAPVAAGRAASVPIEPTNVLLIMRAEVPRIVDDNLREFGPFERGDVVSLPKRSAELMMKHELARKIEVNP